MVVVVVTGKKLNGIVCHTLKHEFRQARHTQKRIVTRNLFHAYTFEIKRQPVNADITQRSGKVSARGESRVI